MSSLILNGSTLFLSGERTDTSQSSKSKFLTDVACHASRMNSHDKTLTCTFDLSSTKSDSTSSHGDRVDITYQVMPNGKNDYNISQRSIKGFHSNNTEMSSNDLAKHRSTVQIHSKQTITFLKQLDKSQKFLEAVNKREYSKVRSFIEAGVNLDCCQANKDGSPAIVIASRNGDATMVKTLLDAGVKPNTKPCKPNARSKTALGYAATSGNLEMVKALIAAKADLELKLDDGTSALFLAIENGELPVANELLNNGASYADSDQNGCSILHLVADKGFTEIARGIIDACPTVVRHTLFHGEDSRGNRPVDYAAAQESEEMLKLLYFKTTDAHHQNHNGDTLLHIAAKKGRASFCRALITEVGAKIDTLNHQRKNALDLATEGKHYECRGVFESVVEDKDSDTLKRYNNRLEFVNAKLDTFEPEDSWEEFAMITLKSEYEHKDKSTQKSISDKKTENKLSFRYKGRPTRGVQVV